MNVYSAGRDGSARGVRAQRDGRVVRRAARGFTLTETGWVQSYGACYVDPSIIYGDVSRREPTTVKGPGCARPPTHKPVNDPLICSVTILQRSTVRDGHPRRATSTRIALAIRDDVWNLEAAGLTPIQLDETLYREGLPPRRADWDD